MSIAKVKEYLRDYGRDCDVQEFPVSSATVELAAKALSVEPARIAKTLSSVSYTHLDVYKRQSGYHLCFHTSTSCSR